MSEFITPDLRAGAAVSPLRLASLALPARPLTDLPPRPQVDVDTLAGVPLLRHLEPALARQLAAHAAVRRLNRWASRPRSTWWPAWRRIPSPGVTTMRVNRPSALPSS